MYVELDRNRVLLSADLAAYVFKRNFFQRPQKERHCVSCRHVATCLQDMLQKDVSIVTSEESHFAGLSRHFLISNECLRFISLSRLCAHEFGLLTSN